MGTAVDEGAQESLRLFDLIVKAAREHERELIAKAIETYLDPTDCDSDPACESCALIRQLAIVARSGDNG